MALGREYRGRRDLEPETRADVTSEPVLALATLATYFVIIVVPACASLQRRDIAGAT